MNDAASMALLSGKRIVVTGAANGIGRATALAFAAEGASVVVNDAGGPRDGSSTDAAAAAAVVEEIRAAGGQAVVSTDSVATASGAEAIVKTALEHFGGLDVLVNNAGILRDKTLLKMTDDIWQAVLDVHLSGSFYCLRAAAQHMRASGGGRIVNTTSVSGLLGNFGQANYAAAKAGIYGLTRTASIELQRFGIFVNAVAPIAKTRLTADLPMFEKLDSLTPDHVARVHTFLASDLSGDRTGLVIGVAGGKLSVFRLVESAGVLKDENGGLWTPQEIADRFEVIDKA
jgi:NAD(P)-dependent dehydrogenase (short-subunit alcohol dehydrogenase family)